jgi:hypothetical protein
MIWRTSGRTCGNIDPPQALVEPDPIISTARGDFGCAGDTGRKGPQGVLARSAAPRRSESSTRGIEPEAVEMALDLVSFRKELARGARALHRLTLSRID